MRKLGLVLAVAALGVSLVPLAQSRPAATALTGVVGPAFNISLTRSGGGALGQLEAGEYTVSVNDQAPDHNFHLRGTGVNEATGVEETGPVSWDVNLVNGVYTYLCDIHPVSMRKTFRIGAAPVVPKLYGRVGPALTISLGTKAGKRTASVKAGAYSVIVKDSSAAHSFHLIGPGVNKKTGKVFKGSVTWRVTLKKGSTYRYFSDAKTTLKGTIKAS